MEMQLTYIFYAHAWRPRCSDEERQCSRFRNSIFLACWS